MHKGSGSAHSQPVGTTAGDARVYMYPRAMCLMFDELCALCGILRRRDVARFGAADVLTGSDGRN